ncbi:mechanosensitive ion channel family protein [Zunongwangia atlantica]|uniref:Small-conductance mechanosensitive ion channel protein n=1 Tax=Zunongwangia atlantica 22II14-10F7 TaxID=1185767 RepID=A0A1Y1T090_9FLAO|nr:mechanosensitive ion channel domain-containing protein [Zunongwangia atlantica]ORL44436.1 small-conductance mechanosensitive ion channel protein [Zunongwangia atlantica 22II14-10F7]
MQNETANQISEVIEQDIWGNIQEFLDFTLLSQPFKLTVGVVLLVIFVFILTSVILRLIRNFIVGKLLNEDKLKFISAFKFVKYVVYLIVILITLSSSGVDISILLTASAALFVGVGLALQELFQDIIGGIFIILDKSLLVGDIIEIDSKVARVFEIKLRTTRALTRDDKVMIIPNHKFISDTVYNYTQNHRTTRECVNVGVAYGSDTQKVKDLLLDCVARQKGVLKNPKPFVLFEDFGDSALLFGVYFYIGDSFTDPKIKSELRFKIDDSFKQNGISIPFPQRDIHIINPQNQSKTD